MDITSSDVAAAVIGALEIQGLAAKQRDCFSFYFAKVPRCSYRVGKVGFGVMAQYHVTLCFAVHKPTYVVSKVM